jgi:invasion protein IalB
MVQTTQVQGQTNPVTQVALGRPTKSEPLRILFLVPVNVSMQAGLRFVYDDKVPPLALAFTRCVPAGCAADGPLPDEIVKRLRARTEPGRFEYKDAGQRDMRFPVSFKGFAQAFDAMLKE